MKLTARTLTNIKPTSGGVAIAQLPVGGWVFGVVGSTDIVGFTHFYRADGTKVELVRGGVSVMCKAFIGTNVISNEAEGTPVDPPPATNKELVQIAYGSMDANGVITWGAGKTYEEV